MKSGPGVAILTRCFRLADVLRRPSDPEATQFPSAPPRAYNSVEDITVKDDVVLADETPDGAAEPGGRARDART